MWTESTEKCVKLPKVIGLVARSRCGKDTVADYIIDTYGNTQTIIKRRLAGPIKKAVEVLYGFTTEHLETDLKDIKNEKYNCSPRDAMVAITRTIMELSGTDFFTNQLYNSRTPSEVTIIPDVRYSHDIERIHNNDGIVIKIERHINTLVHYKNENSIENMEADYTIVNNGTLEELYEQVDSILNQNVLNMAHGL